MFITRAPTPALRPFIKLIWAEENECSVTGREHVLPTGTMHLAIRLSDEPLTIFPDAPDPVGMRIGSAVVGGARSRYYVRELSGSGNSVGVQFQPGGVDLLLGAPAGDLAQTHTSLEDLWGSDAVEARERLLEAGGLLQRIDILESLLVSRLPRARGLHPAVAQALERFRVAGSIGRVVSENGYSHRRFIEIFRRAVGLSPKLYCRITRFQSAVRRIAANPERHWADLAYASGYSDQPHFNREFREFAGLTPGEYRALALNRINHVPLHPSPRPDGQFRSRRRGPRTVSCGSE